MSDERCYYTFRILPLVTNPATKNASKSKIKGKMKGILPFRIHSNKGTGDEVLKIKTRVFKKNSSFFLV